jgi:hypothetical protein
MKGKPVETIPEGQDAQLNRALEVLAGN